MRSSTTARCSASALRVRARCSRTWTRCCARAAPTRATSMRSPSASGRGASPASASASPPRAASRSRSTLPGAGVSTLDALAAGAPGAIPVVDARRREVFALVDGEPSVLAPADLTFEPGTVCVGDGARRYRGALRGGAAPPSRPTTTSATSRARGSTQRSPERSVPSTRSSRCTCAFRMPSGASQ